MKSRLKMFRCVLRTLTNIYDGAGLHIKRLAAKYFRKELHQANKKNLKIQEILHDSAVLEV